MAGFDIYQPKEYIAELSGDVDHMPSVIPRIPTDHWMKTEIRLQYFSIFWSSWGGHVLSDPGHLSANPFGFGHDLLLVGILR